MNIIQLTSESIKDSTVYDKVIKLCNVANKDGITLPDLFKIDWKNDVASLLYKINENLLHGFLLEKDNTLYGIVGYSIHQDILFAPRRVYIPREMRNKALVSTHVMPYLENKIKESNKIRYIVTSFNDTHRGNIHFNLFVNKKYYNVATTNDYFKDFVPVSLDKIKIMYVEQYAIYKKVNIDDEDLDRDKVERLLNNETPNFDFI